MCNKEILEQLKHDRDLCNFNPMTGEDIPISEDCRKSAEALDMAIKAIKKIERIEQILEEMDPLSTIIRIREVLESEDL